MLKKNVFHMVELASKGLSNTISHFSVKEKNIYLGFEEEKNASIFYEYISLLNVAVDRQGRNILVFSADKFKEVTQVDFEMKLEKINKIIHAHSEIFTIFPAAFSTYSLNPDIDDKIVVYAYKIQHSHQYIAEKINSTLGKKFHIFASQYDSTLEITYPQESFFLNLASLKKELQKIEWNIPFFSIHHAAIAGNISGIKFFIERGVCVDMLGPHDETPLHYAVANKNIEAIDFLLENGANINALSAKGVSPLFYAAILGHSEVMEFLFSKKAERDNLALEHQTLLHILAKTDHIDSIKIALKHGCNINARDLENQTPLHYAINHKKIETAIFLIDQNANFKLEDDDGVTPLLLACSLENIPVIIRLLQKGAEVNKQRINHCIAKQTYKGFFMEKGKTFIQYFNGDTPLHWAAIRGNLEIAKILLLHGADINSKDGENNTALHHAAARGHTEIIEYFLLQGALTNIQGSLKMTPLEIALRNEYKEIADILTKNIFEKLFSLILKEKNKGVALQAKEEKVVLAFNEEKQRETFLIYLKFLISSPVKAQKNMISLSVSDIKKIDKIDMRSRVACVDKVLNGHDEIFRLFPDFFKNYSFRSATQDECVVYSYQTNSARLDIAQKFNHALHLFGVSAYYAKGLVNLKFPKSIFLSERFAELKKAVMAIKWSATTSIKIKPVSLTNFRENGSRDERERMEELQRRREEREKRYERQKERELQELFSECRLKTQCETDSFDDWSEIEESLPKAELLAATDVPQNTVYEPDQRVGGVKLIRQKIDDKGKEEAPSEKKKEKKRPLRQKMSLFELEAFVNSSPSSSSSVNAPSKTYAKGFQYYREREHEQGHQQNITRNSCKK